MAFAILPNQGRFPLSDALFVLRDASQQAKDERDARIRHAVGQYAPSATNATLTYEREGTIQIVKITPNQARKAAVFDEVHEVLVTAPPYLAPSFALAWEILWRNLQGDLNPAKLALYRDRVRKALDYRQRDASLVDLHHGLSTSEGILPREAPIGF